MFRELVNAIKILSAKQIREVDKNTILNEPISSIDLMERASRAFLAWFVKTFNLACPVKVFCGIGNNGGDGLAIGRLLHDFGYDIEVYVAGELGKATGDFNTNATRLQRSKQLVSIDSRNDFPDLSNDDVVIDALFGSGLSRPLSGLHEELVEYLNNIRTNAKIAVDIPSGLFAEQESNNMTVFNADWTICFQIPKLSFFLPQNAPLCGEIEFVNIGLDALAIHQQETQHYLVNQEMIRGLLKTRDRFMHKGQAGRAVITAGAFGKMGAAVLATKSCLRAGAGLVSAIVPECGYEIMQISVPEAMVRVSTRENGNELFEDIQYDAFGVGPGIGIDEDGQQLFRTILDHVTTPLVVDADAINILSKNKDWIKDLSANTILTPHPKEFKDLVGSWLNDFEKLELQREFCKKHKVIVLLKGAYTSICNSEGDIYFNPTGNPGMATGGSGDVLTGIITGLLAQGYNSIESCLLGGYLHGLSGDLYVNENSEEGLIAGDLIDFLPKAFSVLRNN